MLPTTLPAFTALLEAELHLLGKPGAWGDLFDKLVETVRYHAMEEEKQIFPAAQKALGETRARTIEAAFMAAERKVLGTV